MKPQIESPPKRREEKQQRKSEEIEVRRKKQYRKAKSGQSHSPFSNTHQCSMLFISPPAPTPVPMLPRCPRLKRSKNSIFPKCSGTKVLVESHTHNTRFVKQFHSSSTSGSLRH
jgi:hypothetical protein